ncbi:MAG: hypothetical protein LBT49_01270 [Prevotellaceae bacterium]|jgi:hypothetical protein|nr:hypothetical protein [Prevotellaceae bacterium]
MMYLPSGNGYVLTPLLHDTPAVGLTTDNELTLRVKDFGYEVYRFNDERITGLRI